jgi:hypothetical protein
VGNCWIWSLIIFLIERFVLVVLGGVVGISLPQLSPWGSRGGGDNFCSAPPPPAGDPV